MFTKISMYPLSLHIHGLHIISIHHQSGTFVTTDEATLTYRYHPKSIVYIRVHSWCLHSMGLDKGTMTCIHHYSIIQSSFTALKFLCALLCNPPSPPTPATNDLFTVSIVLPFPEGYLVGIIEYVTFSDWLLSLNTMHLNFLHVFSQFDISFLYSTE